MAGSNDVRTSYIPCPTTARFLNSVIRKPQPYFLRLGSAVPFVHHALWMAINLMKQGRFFSIDRVCCLFTKWLSPCLVDAWYRYSLTYKVRLIFLERCCPFSGPARFAEKCTIHYHKYKQSPPPLFKPRIY